MDTTELIKQEQTSKTARRIMQMIEFAYRNNLSIDDGLCLMIGELSNWDEERVSQLVDMVRMKLEREYCVHQYCVNSKRELTIA